MEYKLNQLCLALKMKLDICWPLNYRLRTKVAIIYIKTNKQKITKTSNFHSLGTGKDTSIQFHHICLLRYLTHFWIKIMLEYWIHNLIPVKNNSISLFTYEHMYKYIAKRCLLKILGVYPGGEYKIINTNHSNLYFSTVFKNFINSMHYILKILYNYFQK